MTTESKGSVVDAPASRQESAIDPSSARVRPSTVSMPACTRMPCSSKAAPTTSEIC
jgi:hypothetical protein